MRQLFEMISILFPVLHRAHKEAVVKGPYPKDLMSPFLYSLGYLFLPGHGLKLSSFALMFAIVWFNLDVYSRE